MLDIVEKDLFQAHMPEVTYLRLDGLVEASKRSVVVMAIAAAVAASVVLCTADTMGGIPRVRKRNNSILVECAGRAASHTGAV